MHAVAAVAGCLIVCATMWDAFETQVLPRTPLRRLRLTRLFYRTTWTVWAAGCRRLAARGRCEQLLAIYGPASVFVLLTLWVNALVVGFALLQWSQRELLTNLDGVPHFSDDLYMSGTTLFALGLGDLAPKGRIGRLLIVAETGSSLVLLSMLFSYIPTLYQSFARRERQVTVLHAWAGSPPSAAGIVRQIADGCDASHLDAFFADWQRWCADLHESHLSYPVIGYFRSQHLDRSWVAALTALLDTTALMIVGIDDVSSWRARLTFATARDAAVDLAHVLGEPVTCLVDRLPARELEAIRSELARDGLHLRRSSAADEELAALRQSYEPHVAALANGLEMPLPDWRRNHRIVAAAGGSPS